jgi:hypothetical protein
VKPHVKIYMTTCGYGEQDFIPCEVCGARAVDVHHIKCRGMGATNQRNYIGNLMGLCRRCHVLYGDLKAFYDFLQEIHDSFISKLVKGYGTETPSHGISTGNVGTGEASP